MNVEHALESLTLSFEEGVQYRRRHVSQCRALGEGDHRQGHPIGSGEQFGRELVGGIKADRDPGHLPGVEAGDEPLPLLTGRDEHGCGRDHQLMSTDATQVIGPGGQPRPTHPSSHPAGAGGDPAVAERERRDHGAHIKASPHPTTLSWPRPRRATTARTTR